MIQPLRDDLMVQQQLPAGLEGGDAAWQHMTAVIMLNQTGRKPVKIVAPIFWNLWPNAYWFLQATEQEVKDVIWSMGMVNVRYQRLRRMSEDFLTWDREDATMLYGIGKYGSDSYEIFFKQNYYDVRPTDKELQRYLREEIYGINQTNQNPTTGSTPTQDHQFC
jgi:methyl-CpG-binding domain protein 4